MVKGSELFQLVVCQEPEVEKGLRKGRVDFARGELDQGGQGQAHLGEFGGKVLVDWRLRPGGCCILGVHCDVCVCVCV